MPRHKNKKSETEAASDFTLKIYFFVFDQITVRQDDARETFSNGIQDQETVCVLLTKHKP